MPPIENWHYAALLQGPQFTPTEGIDDMVLEGRM
jgi:hypothetical protein